MANWVSAADMVKGLELHVDAADPQAIRDEVRRAMAAIHPDRTGGLFKDADTEARWRDLSDALEFLDRPIATAVVPIQDIPALVLAVKQALESTSRTLSEAEARAEFRAIGQAELRQQMLLPRVSSGLFAAACAFLLTMGGRFSTDPVLGPLLSTRSGRLFTLSCLMCSAFLFMITWVFEQRRAAQLEWLATEGGLRHIVANMFARVRDEPSSIQAAPEMFRFSFSDFVRSIRGDGPRANRIYLLGQTISPASAERLAKVHLNELERRAIVSRTDGKRLDVTFEIRIDVAAGDHPVW